MRMRLASLPATSPPCTLFTINTMGLSDPITSDIW